MKLQPELIGLYWYVVWRSFRLRPLTFGRDLESNLTPLLLDFAPSLLAPTARRGRQAIKAALSKVSTTLDNMTWNLTSLG